MDILTFFCKIYTFEKISKETQKGTCVPLPGTKNCRVPSFENWNLGRKAFHFLERNKERNAFLNIKERLMFCALQITM